MFRCESRVIIWGARSVRPAPTGVGRPAAVAAMASSRGRLFTCGRTRFPDPHYLFVQGHGRRRGPCTHVQCVAVTWASPSGRALAWFYSRRAERRRRSEPSCRPERLSFTSLLVGHRWPKPPGEGRRIACPARMPGQAFAEPVAPTGAWPFAVALWATASVIDDRP